MPTDETSQEHQTKEHIRGSTLLLSGRVLSLTMNLVVQILTVRYLSKLDYGAFAYALSLVSVCASLTIFGLDKAVSRFLPIYQENEEYDKLFGAIFLMVSTICTLGIAIILAIFAMSGVIGEHVVSHPLSLTLLLMLIALAPVEAYDAFLVSMFAAFANPWAIFFRRHVLGPGLKIAAVAVTIYAHGSVQFLAIGYLGAGVLGIAINSVVLYAILRNAGVLEKFSLRSTIVPAREIYSFSAPLLSSDLAFLVRGSLAVVVLESFASTPAVAEFRSVLPIARLNEVVLVSFSFLFMPLASRMYARDDREQINELYWQTTSWVAVLSLPIFLVCFSLAQPLTVLLFGDRYANSGGVLALLSVGYFMYAVFGFAVRTLRVYNKVAYIVITDIIATVVAVVLYWLLIPTHGALGAAVAACATMIVHTLSNQYFLYRATGISLFNWHYARLYVLIGVASLLLYAIRITFELTIFTGIPVALAIWVLFLSVNRDLLDVESTFPELLRLPIARRFFGHPKPVG